MDLMLIYEADEARKRYQRRSQVTALGPRFQEFEINGPKGRRKSLVAILGNILVSIGHRLKATSSGSVE